MQLNAGINSIVKDCYYWSGADSETYPVDPDLTRNANLALERVSMLIMRSDARWKWRDSNKTGLNFVLTNLVSGQEDYSIATTHLKIVGVRYKNAQGDYIRLIPRDRRDLSDSERNADAGTPLTYDLDGFSVFLNPKPAAAAITTTDGLELEVQQGADLFLVTDTTKSPGFASQFHRLRSLYAALDYTETNDLESRSAKIRARIGNAPDLTQGIRGSGLEGELVDFYSSRDQDMKPNLSVQREDYGQSGMIDGGVALRGHPDRW